MIDQTSIRGSLERNIKLGIKAPEFPAGRDWLNVSQPLSLKALEGKIVLLDFWTFCCINCMHVIPDLKFLESEFPSQLAVIGVHSAKFENDQNSEKIRKSILRYEVAHPVVNDHELEIWRSYGVHAWPTLVLVDPEGNVVLHLSGEGHREILKAAIQELIAIYREKGSLIEEPLQISPESDGAEESTLRFPGKILVSEGKIFIADSNHNRILATDLEGHVLDVVGSGEERWSDGDFESAAFNNPQGMSLSERLLYVADTDAHLIRLVDFEKRIVKTIAGTGVQGQLGRGGNALDTAISSPWDVALIENRLFITMAGVHQIWLLNLQTNELQPFAGSGREDIIDESSASSALAQPSGISFDGDHRLYFADSETSSIRVIDLKEGRVQTLAGKGLFEFGNRVGSFGETHLQHPLGVHYHKGKLYVADTYNDIIKIFHLSEQKTEKFSAGDLSLDEPGGLWIEKEVLYVADTNNHRILAIGLDTGAAHEIEIRFRKDRSTVSPRKIKNVPFAREK